MKRSEIILGLIRIPLDILASIGALVLAYQLRTANIDLLPNVQFITQDAQLPLLSYYLSQFVLPWTVVYVAVLATLQLYSLRTTLGPWREIGRVILGSIVWVALIMGWFFLVQRQLFFSRILLVHATIFITVFSLAGRTVILLIQRTLLTRGVGVRHVVSCGSLPLSPTVRQFVMDDPRYRYDGHIETEGNLLSLSMLPDLILHTDPNPGSEMTATLIDYCRSHHIGYAFLPPVFADVPHQLSFGSIGLVPMLRFEPTPLDGWGRVCKRLGDIVVGSTLLILLSPILALTMLAIIVSCGFPVFYVSRRVGQYGRETVRVLKFRTMCRDADAMKKDLTHLSHRTDGPLFKIKDDPRVTPIGRFLRRFSIDELPQLINVVLGNLSLVGPRPHLPEEVERYQDKHRRVFTVRPGVTGLAQISGRSNLPFEEEVKLDMRYIEDWSIGLDLWILWRTFFVVVFGRGAD